MGRSIHGIDSKFYFKYDSGRQFSELGALVEDYEWGRVWKGEWSQIVYIEGDTEVLDSVKELLDDTKLLKNVAPSLIVQLFPKATLADLRLGIPLYHSFRDWWNGLDGKIGLLEALVHDWKEVGGHYLESEGLT